MLYINLNYFNIIVINHQIYKIYPNEITKQPAAEG